MFRRKYYAKLVEKRRNFYLLISFFFILFLLTVGQVSSYANFNNGQSQNDLIVEEESSSKNNGIKFSDYSENISLIKEWDENLGNPNTIFVEDNLLYFGHYIEGVNMADISDPTNPVLLHSFAKEEDILSMFVKDDILFLGKEAGLEIIDVSTPTNPLTIKELLIYDISDIKIIDNFAYILDYTGHFYIYDITDLNDPEVVDWLEFDWQVSTMDIEGDILCISNRTGGFYLYNHSDPTNLTLIGEFDTNSLYVFDISIENGFIYQQDDLGFVICNITDLENITLIKEYEPEEYTIHDIEVVDDVAYISDGFQGIVILNVSDKSNVEIISIYDNLQGSRTFFLLEDMIIADNFLGYVDIIDSSDLENPNLIGQIDTKGSALDIEVKDGIAYIANALGGLEVIDFSDNKNETIGNYRDGTTFNSITLYENFAIICSTYGYMKILDITNPSNPTLVSEYTSDNMFLAYYKTEVQGSKVYIAGGEGGVEVIDISVVTNPTKIGTFVTDIFANDIYLKGKYAFVADGNNGLTILDIGNPSHPILVTRLVLEFASGDCLAVNEEEEILFLANVAGFSIIDIADPYNPSTIGSYTGAVHINSIETYNNLVYITTGSSQITIVDCTTIGDLKPVGFARDIYTIYGLDIDNGLLYAAKGYGGVKVYQTLYMPLTNGGGLDLVSFIISLVFTLTSIQYFMKKKK